MKTTTQAIVLPILFFMFFSVQMNFGQNKVVLKSNTILPDTLTNFSVRPAPEWTDLFYRTNGWFGADGVFTMNLNGSESAALSKKDSIFMYFRIL